VNRRIQATYVEKDTYYHGHSISPFKANGRCHIDLRYLLALVNSNLLSWYAGISLPNFGKATFPKLNPQDIGMLPIRCPNRDNGQDQKRYDAIVNLVTRILYAKAADISVDTSALEREIDRTVYELYGLTEAEIEIVEGAAFSCRQGHHWDR
jgi:hypothetical protein